jgi:hypothetical protein
MDVVHPRQNGCCQLAPKGVPNAVLHLLLGVSGGGHLHAHALLAVHTLACGGRDVVGGSSGYQGLNIPKEVCQELLLPYSCRERKGGCDALVGPGYIHSRKGNSVVSLGVDGCGGGVMEWNSVLG